MPDQDQPSPMKSPNGPLEDRLLERLQQLRKRRREDPGFNPVWRLACDLSFRIETGAIDRDQLCGLSRRLLTRSLEERGAWMRERLGTVDHASNIGRLEELVKADAQALSFSEFKEKWQHPALGVVFTAHPTFLLNRDETDRLIAALHGKTLSEGGREAEDDDDAITLEEEHRRALKAIENARTAHGLLTTVILSVARQYFPDDWTGLNPCPFDLASWVGYDMDGRTDIGWEDCIRLRLSEKQAQLRWYLDDLSEIRDDIPGGDLAQALDNIAEKLDTALSHAVAAERLFRSLPGDPAALSKAGNWLSDAGNGKLVSLDPIIKELHDLASNVDDATLAVKLSLLKTQMRIFRLGAGRVHFRMNATQLHNAVRRRLSQDEAVDLTSRTALMRLNELYAQAKPVAVNFAALAMETTTAVRQFLTIAQFVKHIDADSDIRLLIAECERPATVLAALYLARLFGVEKHVDVSPLFETPPALEGGERFLDVLFSQSAYRQAVEQRGRIAIQTGFSDAGRFIGQIPASLSIERLQANMARLVEAHGLDRLECLIFNTHGESMGRGAHPGSLRARLDHVLSPWARRRFDKRGLRLRHETSFQGGDGYLWFADADIALALMTRIMEYRAALTGREESVDEDGFYAAPDITLDFFRRVMRFQESLLASPAYHRSLSAFGLSLLKTTGSRKTRRQFESGSGERPDVSKIRAIPHNAVLQQLGFPVNVLGGIGQATRSGRDPFIEWRKEDGRFSDLMDMVVASRTRASLRTMMAYGSLFDGGYWASRPHGHDQKHLTDACLYLADQFERDTRYADVLELSTRLRIDELLLHRLLAETGEDTQILEAEERDFLALLHAVRIALIQHLFLLASRIPRFSARNDISREDIMELVFELRLPEAITLLREAYPVRTPEVGDYDLHEPSDYPDEAAMDYGDINRQMINPMEHIHDCLLTISVAIANAFHAHG